MSQLLVTFERIGREIERQVVRDGERAAHGRRNDCRAWLT